MELKIESDKVLKAADSNPQFQPLLQTLFPSVFEKKDEITYKIGNIFILQNKNTNTEYECMLTQTGIGKVCFICFSDGNRWLDAIEVKNILSVTENELDMMAGTAKWSFLRHTI